MQVPVLKIAACVEAEHLQLLIHRAQIPFWSISQWGLICDKQGFFMLIGPTEVLCMNDRGRSNLKLLFDAGAQKNWTPSKIYIYKKQNAMICKSH